MESKQCIFPFKYNGKVYADCTSDHSHHDKAWCATEVDKYGNETKWGYCDDDCYSWKARRNCARTDFFNEDGHCVKIREIDFNKIYLGRYKVDKKNYAIDQTRKCFDANDAKKCQCRLEKKFDQVGEACEHLQSGE